MEKNQIIVIEDRGLVSISGEDAKDFLQNIITNDVEKVNLSNSLFSALFTPQGKYLHEFFLIKSTNGFFLDCDVQSTRDLIDHLSKYKLRSKVEIKDLVGDSNHYSATITSVEFSGKSKIEQHKMVYSSLKGKMGNELHALALTTKDQ